MNNSFSSTEEHLQQREAVNRPRTAQTPRPLKGDDSQGLPGNSEDREDSADLEDEVRPLSPDLEEYVPLRGVGSVYHFLQREETATGLRATDVPMEVDGDCERTQSTSSAESAALPESLPAEITSQMVNQQQDLLTQKLRMELRLGVKAIIKEARQLNTRLKTSPRTGRRSTSFSSSRFQSYAYFYPRPDLPPRILGEDLLAQGYFGQPVIQRTARANGIVGPGRARCPVGIPASLPSISRFTPSQCVASSLLLRTILHRAVDRESSLSELRGVTIASPRSYGPGSDLKRWFGKTDDRGLLHLHRPPILNGWRRGSDSSSGEDIPGSPQGRCTNTGAMADMDHNPLSTTTPLLLQPTPTSAPGLISPQQPASDSNRTFLSVAYGQHNNKLAELVIENVDATPQDQHNIPRDRARAQPHPYLFCKAHGRHQQISTSDPDVLKPHVEPMPLLREKRTISSPSALLPRRSRTPMCMSLRSLESFRDKTRSGVLAGSLAGVQPPSAA
ncbi:hypothetical protein BKA62DRAFT_676257 [Auriculariales sp. MPI-PUGE-AT-0066]|nr:hypothetical protein BKA62DRAFT_676257 [Auriculariales sp. MPI-PUGE-AT-0066]